MDKIYDYNYILYFFEDDPAVLYKTIEFVDDDNPNQFMFRLKTDVRAVEIVDRYDRAHVDTIVHNEWDLTITNSIHAAELTIFTLADEQQREINYHRTWSEVTR